MLQVYLGSDILEFSASYTQVKSYSIVKSKLSVDKTIQPAVGHGGLRRVRTHASAAMLVI